MNKKKIIQKIVVGGVIIEKDTVLILKRHSNEDVYPNIWELPSGKKEPLELSENALLREIKEETGLVVKIIIPISVFDYIIEKPSELRDSTQINFLVKPVGSTKVDISKEHQDFAWVKFNDLTNYDITGDTKKVIEKAFGFISKNKI